MYTGEELFYFYKMCSLTLKRAKDKDGSSLYVKDMFFLSLKSKFYQYMRGEIKYPIYGDAWIKLHHRFRSAFEREYLEEECFNLEEAKAAWSAEQRKTQVLDTTKASKELSDKFTRLA
jgi:hypothetical protein